MGASGGRRLQYVTAAALEADGEEQIDWVVEPYVARESITDLVGAAKDAGKTTLALALVQAVLDGQDFLGRPTTKSKVVYLTEERRPTFREALKRAGLLGREDLSILFWQYAYGCSFSTIVESARAECRRIDAKLLIVDTINQFAGFEGEDENHSGPVLEAMKPLQLAAADGLGVVMERHERKAGGRVGKSGRGSTAFTGAADIELLLLRPEGQSKDTVREIHALSRFDQTPALLIIEKTEHGYVSHGAKADFHSQHVGEAILEVLSTQESAITIEALIAHLPIGLNGRTTVQKALTELVDSRVVCKSGRGVKKDPHLYGKS